MDNIDTMRYQPFWFDDALNRESDDSLESLFASSTADVCIIGGGYTGLWTAIKLKQKAPERDIVIIEADLCGSGASGRNGGAMLTWSSKFLSLKRLYGEAEAIRLAQASEQAVWQMQAFCREHDIKAELRVDGAYYTATSEAQKGLLDPVINELDKQGINHWDVVTRGDLQQQSGSALNLAGYYTPHAGSLHPGKLVRGLARVAKAMGVRIYEMTPMLDIIPGPQQRVVTPRGEILSKKVVLASNSWLAHQFPVFRRSILLVSSDMVITEPMPDVLAELGLDHGASIIDSRTFVHYYRTTEDGRLMLGKGGNQFAFANRMQASFDKESRYKDNLTQTLNRFFPQQPLKIARSWNGASDRSVSGFPFFGELVDKPNTNEDSISPPRKAGTTPLPE